MPLTLHYWLVFLVALIPAELLGILWHELGHVLAGDFAGMHVVSWGIGVRKPWLQWRHGKKVFYIGWPLSLGLTIALKDRIEQDQAANFRFILGGPLATLLGLTVGLSLWGYGLRSELLLAWLCTSTLLFVMSALPMTFRRGAVRVDNDAKKLINIWRQRPHEGVAELGTTLASLQVISDLLVSLGQDATARFYQSALALIEIDLHDVNSAQARLKKLEAESNNSESVTKLITVARALISAQQKSDQAEVLVEAASARCLDEPTLRFTLNCVSAQLQHDRGIDVADVTRQLREQALVANRRDWLCKIDATLFLVNPSADPEASCRTLLNNHSQNLSGATKARLLAITTERLITIGDRDRARRVFDEARNAILNQAATIANASTRESFVLNAAAPLQRAVVGAGEGMPLFMSADLTQGNSSTSQAANTNILAHFRPAVTPASKGRAFGRITLGLGIMLATLFSVCAIIHLMRGGVTTERMWFSALPILALGFLLTMLTTCVSLLRGERRYRLIAFGVLLATFAMFAGIFVGAPPSKDRRRSDLAPATANWLP